MKTTNGFHLSDFNFSTWKLDFTSLSESKSVYIKMRVYKEVWRALVTSITPDPDISTQFCVSERMCKKSRKRRRKCSQQGCVKSVVTMKAAPHSTTGEPLTSSHCWQQWGDRVALATLHGVNSTVGLFPGALVLCGNVTPTSKIWKIKKQSFSNK